jgi:CTP synthase
VYVTEDGARDRPRPRPLRAVHSTQTSRDHNFTTRQDLRAVIAKERRGDYLGATVQVIPHVTDEIKERIRKISKGVDIQIVEVGGTVGDIESLPFLEAIRQFRLEVGANAVFVHLTLVPYIGAAGELKTKPTQHSVRELRAIGIQPDVLLCRTDRSSARHQEEDRAVLQRPGGGGDHRQGRGDDLRGAAGPRQGGRGRILLKALDLPYRDKNMDEWVEMVGKAKNPSDGEVVVGIVGKYVAYEDSYKSLNEALTHGGIANNARVRLHWIERTGWSAAAPASRRPWRRATVCSSRRVRSCAAWTGWSRPSGSRARGGSPSSASASGCSAR